MISPVITSVTMQAALSAGDALTAGGVTVNDGAPLIDDHAYAVLACTADTVTLYNPWGIAGGGLPNNGGVLTITAQQAYDDFAGLVW